MAVVGGGAAGLAVARVLADRGVSFLLLEREDHVGGRLAHGAPEADAPAVQDASAFPKGSILTRATALGLYDDDGGRFLAVGALEPEGPRLLKVYAERFVLAPGGHPPMVPFENNDLPGVYAGRAASLLLEAERSGVPTTQLDQAFPGIEITDAYAIQQRNIDQKIADGAPVKAE